MARKRNKDRVGDVLGLGNMNSGPSVPAGEHIRNEADEAHRRHHRMSEGADELTPSPTSPDRSSGATGIDMGSGGEGTDLE